jgi:hypothetical protein
VSITRDAQITHPLGMTAWSDEVPGSLDHQQVDRHAARFSTFAPLYLEHARAPHRPIPRRVSPATIRLNTVAREPVRNHVSPRHENLPVQLAAQSGVDFDILHANLTMIRSAVLFRRPQLDGSFNRRDWQLVDGSRTDPIPRLSCRRSCRGSRNLRQARAVLSGRESGLLAGR